MYLLTPPGFGGVAVVVAIDEPERSALAACLRSPRGVPLRPAAGAPPQRAELHWDDVARDDVLVVDRGPMGLEVHLHGSPVLLDALAARFGPLQSLPASAAELLLRTALSTAQLRLAIEQMSVDFEDFLAGLSRLPAAERLVAVAAAQGRSTVAAAVATPFRLVLVGQQNAGKSTLFNRLLFLERALTGPLPGLTRDPVLEVTCLAEYPYEVVDTAGEGAVHAPVDAAAIARGRAVEGGVRLLVVDQGRGPTAADRALLRPGTLVVATKQDLPPAPWPADMPCDLRVACADPAGASGVRAAVGELLRLCRGLPPAGPVGGPAALNAAQRGALDRLASV